MPKIEAEKEILKSVLENAKISKYKLADIFYKKKIIKSRATIVKKIQELEKKNYVKVTEEESRGGTHFITLTTRGLFYLYLECELEEKQRMTVLNKFLNSKYLEDLKETINILSANKVADVLDKSIIDLRSKINLKHFNKEWAFESLKTVFENYFTTEITSVENQKNANDLLLSLGVNNRKKKHYLLEQIKREETKYALIEKRSGDFKKAFRHARNMIKNY